jgi:hypothetical protein
MSAYTFKTPEYYEDDYPLSAAKGCVSVVLELEDGRRFEVYLVTPERLVQDAADMLTVRQFYAEENMILVPSVERDAVRAAVTQVVESRFVDLLHPSVE